MIRHLQAVGLGLWAVLAVPLAPLAEPDPHDSRLDEERLAALLSVGLNQAAEERLRAAVESGVEAARADLIRLLIRQGRLQEAEELLARAQEPLASRHHFLAGRLYEKLGRHGDALREFVASAAEEPLLADYAAYRAGLAARRLDDPDQALALFETAGGSSRNGRLGAQAWWEAARLAAQSDLPDRALENLERIPSRSVIARHDLLDLEAQIWRSQGESEREVRVLRELLDRAPASEQAVQAVGRLEELTQPTLSDRLAFAHTALRNRHGELAEKQARRALEMVAALETPDPIREGEALLALGKAKIRRREYTAARRELESMPAGAEAEDRAEALLDRARCLWRLDQVDACLVEYDAVAKGEFPEEFQATAAWEAGREAKDDRNWREAADRLGAFADRFPQHDRADDSLWHQGRALAELDDREGALAAFERLRTRFPDSSFFEETTYWIASLHRADGADSLACREVQRLEREHSDSWWTQRARATAGDCAHGVAAQATVEARDWLAELSPGLDSEQARKTRDSVRRAEPFRRAAALASTGLLTEAESELGVLRRGLERDTGSLIAFADAAWKAGVPRAAMRAISVVRARSGLGILSGKTPAAVARMLYPVDHLDSVLHWAEEYGVDPMLVYAVMREESWFQADVVSWAGAYGLLQIMPSTGRDLARRIGVKNFERGDLFDPDVNIRFGAFYLSRLLRELDSEPALALSAYNAGKRNALRWRKGLEEEFDVDRYVAGITYKETYNYVQKVGRSWAIYQHLWGDLVPELQQDARGDR